MLTKLGVGEERRAAYPVGNQLSGFLSTSEMARDEHSGNKRAGNLFVLDCKSLPQCGSLTTTEIREPITGAKASNDFVDCYL